MKLFVAGEECGAELHESVCTSAEQLASHPDALAELEPFHSTLILREAEDQSDYTKNLLDLLVLKGGGSCDDFYIQRRPGFIGTLSAAFKAILWKLFRYQHERVAFQQNAVNMQLTVALQFMHEEYTTEIAELRKQLADVQGDSCRDA